MFLEALAVWLVCAFAAFFIAAAKGRSGCAFAALAFLLGPIGLLVAAVVGADRETLTRRKLRNGVLRKCPRCAEAIQRDARTCRYCGCDLSVIREERSLVERAIDRLAGI